MSPLIELKNVAWATPDGTPLLDAIDLTFGAERTGLIGRNGVGKTTLLKIMSGEIMPSSGNVARSGTIEMLRQQAGPPPDQTVAEAFGAAEALKRLARIEAGQGSDADLDGADWTLEVRLASALADADLAGLDPDRRLATLSGGQATRVALAALLFAEPDLLLLDEPTNNLDAAGRAVIADMLSAWKGGAVVVSHDRGLLGRMDRIVEMSGLGARVYGGNWDHYVERKSEERASAEHRLSDAQRALDQVDRDIQTARERQARRDSRGRLSRVRRDQPKSSLDFNKASAERSAARGDGLAERKRRDAAATLAEARRNVESLKALRVDAPSSGVPSGKRILDFDRVSWRTPGGVTVIADMSLSVVGPERIAIAGPNGAGKTTVLRLATGALKPSGGQVRCAVKAAMLDQNVEVLDPLATVLENFRHINPEQTDHGARAMLARFLFRNVDALKPVASLSGGERLRAGLAAVLGGAAAPQLLILDEPTNHLDLDSIEVIETALAGYDGALLVASHDESFLDAIRIERRIDLGSPET
jgi:ATPase subunit of ABC transporter with duplicated ATPase domains